MKELAGICLVTFDVRNTVLKVCNGVGYQYSLIAKRYQIDSCPNKINESFKQAWKTQNKKFPVFGARDGITSKQWWSCLVLDTFHGAGYKHEKLPLLAEELYHYFETPSAWEVHPEAHETLEHVKSCKITMGAISNFDERLNTILKNLNLRQYFDFVIFSQKMSVEKPDPRIFQAALDLAKCPPYKAIHIGDNYENDYIGPISFGMNALLLVKDAKNMPKDLDPKFVIGNLTELKNIIK